MKSQVFDEILSSGVSGIKKAKLKKAFGSGYESHLQDLLQDEKVVVDQKGISYFVWTKENYQSHLFANDPKFKIILNLVKNLENSIEQVKIQTPKTQTKGDNLEDKFTDEFDKQLVELSTSIGWIPFSEIRKKICDTFDIVQTTFYSYASQLIDTNPEKYEVSTGGHEGIMIRGLLHGYVRRI